MIRDNTWLTSGSSVDPCMARSPWRPQPGTLIGKRILKRVDERTFVSLFKLAMLLAGLKVLAYDGLYKILTAAG